MNDSERTDIRKIECVFDFETIVFGGTVEALACSVTRNLPLIFVTEKRPHPFKKYKHFDLNFYWDRAVFLASLGGLCPTYGKIKKAKLLQLEGEHRRYVLKLFNDYSKIAEYYCDNIIFFDEEGVEGLETTTKNTRHFLVIDRILIPKRFHGQEVDAIFTDGKAFKEVHFLSPSEAVGISYLEDWELESFNEMHARFRMYDLMSEVGNPAQRIEVLDRQKVQMSRDEYVKFPGLEFNGKTVEDIGLYYTEELRKYECLVE